MFFKYCKYPVEEEGNVKFLLLPHFVPFKDIFTSFQREVSKNTFSLENFASSNIFVDTENISS